EPAAVRHAHRHPRAGEGDRALPDREAAHPQGAAPGARGSGRRHQPPGYDAQGHQHPHRAVPVRARGARCRAVAAPPPPGAHPGGGHRMSARRVAWLLVAALVIIAFAIWVSSLRHLERATLAGDLVLPGLEPAVNTVTQVQLHKGNGTQATLARGESGWLVSERGWPAELGKVRKLLLDLGAL